MTVSAAVAGSAVSSRQPAPATRPSNLEAQRITGRPYLSHSQLSLMRTCPRKFAYTYIENAERDFLPSSLIFGGSVHAALELHFRCRLEGLTTTHQALLSAYQDAWQRELRDAGDNVT